jgi:hypothetical protein
MKANDVRRISFAVKRSHNRRAVLQNRALIDVCLVSDFTGR